jgi:hypothetical protein
MNEPEANMIICKKCLIGSARKFAMGKNRTDACYLCSEISDELIEVSSDEKFRRYANAFLKYSCDSFDFCGPDWIENLHKMLISNKWIVDLQRSSSPINSRAFVENLFACDGFGGQNHYELSGIMQELKWKNRNYIKNRIQKRFFEFGGLLNDIDSICDDIIKHLVPYDPPSVLYRARRGYKTQSHENGRSEICAPYTDEEICAPSTELATDGRVNRIGFSVLYLSENERTAIHEVRPNPGDKVSIAQFRVNKGLEIANLFDLDFISLSQDEDMAAILNGIATLSKMFSEPVGSSGKHLYLPTQLFCERLIRNGINGICYKSSFTGDRNVALFGTNSASFIQKSSRLFDVKSIEVTYAKRGQNVQPDTSRAGMR